MLHVVPWPVHGAIIIITLLLLCCPLDIVFINDSITTFFRVIFFTVSSPLRFFVHRHKDILIIRGQVAVAVCCCSRFDRRRNVSRRIQYIIIIIIIHVIMHTRRRSTTDGYAGRGVVFSGWIAEIGVCCRTPV
uniref:Uncharacterized protein n=1 Tax=Schizaphis graminum TaxID=13262 RepID=A0A2S2N916_SCHGA